jgi:hypothetical protein
MSFGFVLKNEYWRVDLRFVNVIKIILGFNR